ncbi:phosphoethanolamine transferase [Marinobacter sp. C2H3]|uniref:phosphoethanolamine transferase n=1 Tax=Marinobacter sp. C2H3 TaxID=3119003 RepID=UPI00300F178D
MAFTSDRSDAASRGHAFSLKPQWLVLMAALMFTAFYNAPFYHAIQDYIGFDQPLLMIKLVVLLLLVNHFIIGLFSVRFALKPVLVFLFLAGAASTYFMNAYGVLIDRDMLQNAMETDAGEVAGLLNVSMLWHGLLYFVLPVAILWRIQVRWPRGFRQLGVWLIPLALDLVLVLGLALTSYDEMASTFRNHRDIKDLVVPVSGVSALAGLAGKAVASETPPFRTVGEDAAVSPTVAERGKPNLVLFVLGETARADHFAINGYPRDTTPELSRLASEPDSGLVNFPKTSSCGTATAFSVPCMFSWTTRDNYDEVDAKNSDNLLDIMARAGIDTLWLDNQSGCKDMCNRIPHDKPDDPALCADGDCHDEALVTSVRKRLAGKAPEDRFIVLHEMGSHGPEYYKRSQPSEKAFKPECRSNELQSCDLQTIINAYDNSIRVTDDTLGKAVKLLKSLSDQYNTALVYVSDHGESLGENGLYLHGIPYMIAPDEQTHVPMVMWFSDGFAWANNLDRACLAREAQKPTSHDALFSSLLAMMNVKTSARTPDLNLFRSCRSG